MSFFDCPGTTSDIVLKGNTLLKNQNSALMEDNQVNCIFVT